MKKSSLVSFKFLLLFITLLFIGLVIVPFGLHASLTQHYKNRVYTNTYNVPVHYSALVLGAGVNANGSPSDVLADRLNTAAALYRGSKVNKLIVSGDNRVSHYNEPEAMQKALISIDIPASAIQPDYAGRRTYDSCWRAKNIFSQDKIVVVTQSFHMTRALFICNTLGVDAVGIVSDTSEYDPFTWTYWSIRDVYALTLSLVDLYIRQPYVVGGDKIQI